VYIAPTPFLIHDAIYEQFVGKFVAETKALKLCNGLEESVTIGPLANDRR
jgi:succinate-semialdehyde dehydrogenase/glutarate-semialdehyde dehydrogenase